MNGTLCARQDVCSVLPCEVTDNIFPLYPVENDPDAGRSLMVLDTCCINICVA